MISWFCFRKKGDDDKDKGFLCDYYLVENFSLEQIQYVINCLQTERSLVDSHDGSVNLLEGFNK